MKHLTIRNLPENVAKALDAERKHRAESLNSTVIDLLRCALGVGVEARQDNGLGALAGTWNADDLEEFENATNLFEQVDPELWR